MKIIDGAIVLGSMPFPRGDGKVAVRGIWTGGDWKPGDQLLVHHFNEQIFAGTWKISGIDLVSGIPRETVLILSPVTKPQPIRSGDILIFGQGAFSIFRVQQSKPPIEASMILDVGERGSCRALARASAEGQMEVLVFHEVGLDLELASFRVARKDSEVFKVELSYVETQYPFYTVDFRLAKPRVPVGRVIETLSHARSFVLAAGQEMMNLPRLRGRYPDEVVELFEPRITAKAGSVHLFLHAAPPIQRLPFDRAAPLKLLADSLKTAASGDSQGVVKLLAESLQSIDFALKQLEDIVKISINNGDISVSASDSPEPFTLGSRALSTLETSKSTLQLRMLKRDGSLDGLMVRRNWCKFSPIGEGEGEEWTLKYSPDLKRKVQGQIPRLVSVIFETKSPPDSTQGTGRLLGIENLEQI
jgi:hypothetical protein